MIADIKAGWADARRAPTLSFRTALCGWWDYRLGYWAFLVGAIVGRLLLALALLIGLSALIHPLIEVDKAEAASPGSKVLITPREQAPPCKSADGRGTPVCVVDHRHAPYDVPWSYIVVRARGIEFYTVISHKRARRMITAWKRSNCWGGQACEYVGWTNVW